MHILFRPPRNLLVTSILLFSLAGCANVPKEAVELSYQMGADLEVLHKSYDLMIVGRFDDFRIARENYLNNEWTPVFIGSFIKDGRLVETANGEVVWSNTKDKFVPPTQGKEEVQLFQTIKDWAESAVRQVSKKRASLIDPLNEQEAQIRTDLADAFGRLRTANTYITAHLNSIRKVARIQSKALDRFGLDDVIKKLDKTIGSVSEQAKIKLESIRKADAKFQ